MTVLTVSHLALLLPVLQNTVPRRLALTALTVLAVSPVVAVSVVTATPLKLNPPFSDILITILQETHDAEDTKHPQQTQNA